MTNHVEFQGRIDGWIKTVSANDGLRADFTLTHGGNSFQVQCIAHLSKPHHTGDVVTVCGRIEEDAGDVYIFADEIVPDRQLELGIVL
jgi:hypothetical protein